MFQAAQQVLKMGKVKSNNKEFSVMPFVEQEAVEQEAVEQEAGEQEAVKQEPMDELPNSNDLMAYEIDDDTTNEEYDENDLNSLLLNDHNKGEQKRNRITDKFSQNQVFDLDNNNSANCESLFTKRNQKIFFEINNSHEFPFYLYEYCPDVFYELRQNLVQMFQFRIFKLEKNYLIESKYDKSENTEECQKMIDKVLAYVNKFNQKKFDQHEINTQLGNKYFWYFVKETLTPAYAKSDEVSLILRDSNDPSKRLFRIDGTRKVIEREKVSLREKIGHFYKELERLDTNGPTGASLFYEPNKKSCLLQ